MRAFRIAVAATFVVGAFLAGGLGKAGSSQMRTEDGTPIEHAAPPNQVALVTSPPYPIQHVVVIVQENRTVDNLLNGVCVASGQCTDTVTTDPYTGTPLHSLSLAANVDPDHHHAAFVTEFNNQQMNGWNNATNCGGNACYAYAPMPEISPGYTQICVRWTCADEVQQMNQGPSYVAHQYLIAGQSGGDESVAEQTFPAERTAIIDNPVGNGGQFASGCASTTVTTTFMSMLQPYPGVSVLYPNTAPCGDYRTVFDNVAAIGESWQYYGTQLTGPVGSAAWLWAGVPGVAHLNGSGNYRFPPSQFLTDVSIGFLANLSYIVPPLKDSDHPVLVNTATDGPSWVASLINIVGSQPTLWNSTAIIVVWDDWGGWYDHVKPFCWSPRNPYECGFRVPVMIISPYVRQGWIDHTPRTDGAILHFIEDVLGTRTLGTMDTQTDDLLNDFCFSNGGTCTPAPFGAPLYVTPGFTP